MSSLAPLDRFWMVARKPNGPHARSEPKQRYSSLADARDAAAALAESTGAAFLILETVEIIRPGERPDATGSLFGRAA